MKIILKYLRQPSTYAGIGAIIGALNMHVSQDMVSAVSQVAMALAGLAAVVLDENSAA
jgi:sulfite exporter TauE/SafE